MRALDATRRPFDVALRRRVGQHEPARGVGPVGRDDVVGIDHVLLRLRHRFDRADRDRLSGLDVQHALALAMRPPPRHHPFAVGVLVGLVRDHALGEEALERLVDGDVTGTLCMARVKKRA